MIYELYETIPKVRDSEANYTKEKGTQLVTIFRECYTVPYTELHGVIIFLKWAVLHF